MTEHLLNTVLLLEDESIIAIDMEDMLIDQGAAIVVCLDTSAAALDWLAVNRPDLAIVDPRLKDGPCSAVARHLKENVIPFIVYSGDVGGATEFEPAFATGVWLNKPSEPAQVIAAIAAALRT